MSVVEHHVEEGAVHIDCIGPARYLTVPVDSLASLSDADLYTLANGGLDDDCQVARATAPSGI